MFYISLSTVNAVENNTNNNHKIDDTQNNQINDNNFEKTMNTTLKQNTNTENNTVKDYNHYSLNNN